LKVALDAYVAALRQDGWFSFPAAKTLLALAVASRFQELSINFIRSRFQSRNVLLDKRTT
jgi:hypothetical protein